MAQAPRTFPQALSAASESTPAAPETTTSAHVHTASSHQHQTKEPATAWQAMAEFSHTQHEGAPGSTCNLSFYQRHFTKPITSNPEKQQHENDRSFSLRSRGFLVAALMMLLILLGIVGAAVGVTLSRYVRHRHEATAKHPSPIHLALEVNFPDPALYLHEKTWYAYATNNAAGILGDPANAPSHRDGISNIQVATSTNFMNWTLLDSTHDPLPTVGAWAIQGHENSTHPPVPRANVWAPSVTKQQSEDGNYIMYYAAARNRLSHPETESEPRHLAIELAPLPGHPVPHCIGAATASSPQGPFQPLPTPIACPISEGGAIDAAAFTDDDSTPYLLYKVDGNNIGHGGECGNIVQPRVNTPIMLQKLESDGTSPDGAPILILNRTATDGPLVEAPELVRSHEGVYFLFFSSGCTRNPSYDLKYATADKITGPYTRASAPLLLTGDWDLHAPGSAGVFPVGNGQWNLVFHARVQGRIRAMFAGRLVLKGRKAKFVALEHG
ncbi:hypothetical protein Q7P35_002620 [Cladosporium inversicolor]